MNDAEFKKFHDRFMRKSGQVVPARLQAALALLERLRDHPSLSLKDHHRAAHEAHQIEPINKNHGRRSSDLSAWGQPLLDAVKASGFAKDAKATLDATQAQFAKALRTILELEPLTVRTRARSAEAAIADILEQADKRGKAGAVAQYLVGAKLQLRFPALSIPVHPFNKGDRKKRGDEAARLADFEIADAVIEVALGPPDEKHVEQVRAILDESEKEAWLLVRGNRLASWRTEIGLFETSESQRIVVVAVEVFVGQNVTELGAFSTSGKEKQLRELFQLYNNKWVKALGPPSLTIVAK